MREPERAVAFCEQQFAAGGQRGQRFLASAYLAAGDHENARTAISAGLALEPEDARLIATRGELKAATGDPAGALADWREALELDHDEHQRPLQQRLPTRTRRPTRRSRRRLAFDHRLERTARLHRRRRVAQA